MLGVWTAHDFREYPDLPGGLPDLERPPLATGRVRWAGEPIAVVVAEDRYIAADAVAAVHVDYHVLPAVSTIRDALAPDAELLFPEHGSNALVTVPMLDDLDRAMEACDERAQLRVINQRCAVVPIETMACLADWNIDGLTMWATFQAPHHLRNKMSAWLNIPQNQCRIITPNVGGGFGAKIVFAPEFFITPLLSKMGRKTGQVFTKSDRGHAADDPRARPRA